MGKHTLKGTAKGALRDNMSISKVEEIWLDDPNWEGLKISYGDYISKGFVIFLKNRNDYKYSF